MGVTYEEALKNAEDWACGRQHCVDSRGRKTIATSSLEAQESMKWSTLTVAIAAGGPEIKAGQR